MSRSIYRRRWRRPGCRAKAVVAAQGLTLPEQFALAMSALQGARATVQQLWEDAPAQYAAGNLDVASAAGWSATFAAEAAVIDGAIATINAGVAA